MKARVASQEVFGFAVASHRRGRRRGLGARVAHSSRPVMGDGSVAHVTVKLIGGMPSLRSGEALGVVRSAIGRVNGGGVIRIVEYSIQSNHVHLIVEASSSADLSEGMKSLNVGLGMRLNRIWGRTGEGSVLADRYHLVVISSPPQMRNVLNYVLRNDVHHGLNLRTLDPCSSAPAFGGWRQMQRGNRRLGTLAAARDCVGVEPQTWLLRVGWQRVKGRRELLSTQRGPRKAQGKASRSPQTELIA